MKILGNKSNSLADIIFYDAEYKFKLLVVVYLLGRQNINVDIVEHKDNEELFGVKLNGEVKYISFKEFIYKPLNVVNYINRKFNNE